MSYYRAEREQFDHIRIAAEKKALQERPKQNIVVATKKKPAKSKYTFDMLNTDDETDDETNPKQGRPTPPEWSLGKFNIQSVRSGFFSYPLFIIRRRKSRGSYC